MIDSNQDEAVKLEACPSEVSLVCPIAPHEMPKRMRHGFEDLVERVSAAAVIHGLGKDLLLRVYLSGLWHGVELSKGRCHVSG